MHRQSDETALLRIEMLYPFPIEKLRKCLKKYGNDPELVWVQEEPKNMGAWSYVKGNLETISGKVHYVGRGENATTATGSNRKHKQEQSQILKQAFEAI